MQSLEAVATQGPPTATSSRRDQDSPTGRRCEPQHRTTYPFGRRRYQNFAINRTPTVVALAGRMFLPGIRSNERCLT